MNEAQETRDEVYLEELKTEEQTEDGPTLEVQKGDIIGDRFTRGGGGSDTGYPFNLKEEEVVKLIYFFGSRKASHKALASSSKTHEFTTAEKKMLEKIFTWFGFVAMTPAERKAAYRAVISRFKSLCGFLRSHPAFITVSIKTALEEHGYLGILRNIVMVVSADGKIQPRVVDDGQKKSTPPIGQLDSLMWEFQNVALDKLRMIVDSIEYKDVKKANLGMKSKALRDIYSVIHMVRLGNKNPNMTLVSVNVNTAEGKEKLAAYSTYVTKNREQ